MIFIIIEEDCISCGLCSDVCPVQAISPLGVYRTNPKICNGCGECASNCPVQAIRPVDEAEN